MSWRGMQPNLTKSPNLGDEEEETKIEEDKNSQNADVSLGINQKFRLLQADLYFSKIKVSPLDGVILGGCVRGALP